jgi:hypothetical protein
MIDWGNPETLWILTNWCLWGAVVVSGLLIGREILKTVRLQFRPNEQPVPLDDHSFLVPELGMTMADGGKRTDAPSSMLPTPKSEE